MARVAFARNVHNTIRIEIACKPLYDLRTGFLDNRGRQITANAYRGHCIHVEGPREQWVGTKALPVGEYYWASVQIGRNGQNYGPGCETAYFETEAERDAYVEKRFDKIMANAAKKFAK